MCDDVYDVYDENCKTFNFYKMILSEFSIPFSRDLKRTFLYILNSKEYITVNNKKVAKYTPHFVFKVKKNLSDIIFNPLNENIKSYSMLLLKDQVHTLASEWINLFIKDFLEKKLDSTNQSENIKELPECNELTIRKWNNIYKIVTETSFSKNLIDFSFSLNENNSVQIKFTYPLFNLLKTMVHHIFGVMLEKHEIKLFTEIYQQFITDLIEKKNLTLINIPIKSNQHPHLYALIQFYLDIRKEISSSFIGKYTKSLQEKIASLNELTSYKPSEDINKLDHEFYLDELKIRKESEPNWLLVKDNAMGKNKQQPAVNENNNIGQVVDKFGYLIEYDLKQYQNKIRKLNTEIFAQEYRDNYQRFKNNQEWNEIFNWQKLVLDILKYNGGSLWYDSRIKKYCFRSKTNASTVDVNSSELGDLLTRAFKKYMIGYLNENNSAIEIVLVSKLKSINTQKLSIYEGADNVIKILVFENEIFTIDDDVFDTNINCEFIRHNTDLLFTRNRFLSNKYLIKRYQQNQLMTTSSTEQTFIEKFIYYLVKENQELSDYIVNWLAYYFKNLQKSKTVLVLLGEQEVTKDIFWNIIIKEIFSKQYCTTIDDKECDTTFVSDIAKDKLFFHIDDIIDADTKFDDETLALIIKDLLTKPLVTTDTNEEVYIHGQILITAKNPAPYLKKVLSKCTVIEINNIDTIMEKLDVEDEAELEDTIYSDLDNFTNRLANYKIISENAQHRIDTEIRETLKGNKSSNVDKDDINKQLNSLIQAIKNKDKDYFEKVYGTKDKKGADAYEHLKNAFNKDDGYFIGQDMYLYYNAIHEVPFKTNKSLMDELKLKDDMFKQEVKVLKILTKDGKEDVLFSVPSGSKETGNKDLYKIADYKLAEDIKIPDGATVISSQEKLDKFTFTTKSEKEKCIQRTKEYKDKKKKKNNKNNIFISLQ